MKTIKENIALANSEGYNVIVVITRMDEVIDVPAEHESAMRDAKAVLNVDSSSIFFHINYNDSKMRVPSVDLSCFFILRTVYERARDFMKANLREVIHQIPWKCETVLKDTSIVPIPIPIPVPVPVPDLILSPRDVWKDENDHIRGPNDNSLFCGVCGKTYIKVVPENWTCDDGHKRRPGDLAKFCGVCGKEYKKDGEWKCPGGHIRPDPSVRFCGTCGGEFKLAGGGAVKCPSGHPRPVGSESGFCGVCGAKFIMYA